MSTTRTFRYLGFFSDPSYGPDFEGELFESPTAAGDALRDRERHGHDYRQPTVHAGTAEETRDFMPCVSTEATIELFKIPALKVEYGEDGAPVTEIDVIERREQADIIAKFGKRGGVQLEFVH